MTPHYSSLFDALHLLGIDIDSKPVALAIVIIAAKVGLNSFSVMLFDMPFLTISSFLLVIGV